MSGKRKRKMWVLILPIHYNLLDLTIEGPGLPTVIRLSPILVVGCSLWSVKDLTIRHCPLTGYWSHGPQNWIVPCVVDPTLRTKRAFLIFQPTSQTDPASRWGLRWVFGSPVLLHCCISLFLQFPLTARTRIRHCQSAYSRPAHLLPVSRNVDFTIAFSTYGDIWGRERPKTGVMVFERIRIRMTILGFSKMNNFQAIQSFATSTKDCLRSDISTKIFPILLKGRILMTGIRGPPTKWEPLNTVWLR